MSETSTDTAAAMRLRADPPRVTRISRKVIIGLGVVAGLGRFLLACAGPRGLFSLALTRAS